MKVNLLVSNPHGCLAGYANLDPLSQPGEKTIKAQLDNLDEFIDDSECEEIRAVGILSLFAASKLDEVVQNWIKKLRKGGKLIIVDADATLVSKAFIRGDLNEAEFNAALFGKQENSWEYHRSCLTLYGISEALKGKGLKIEEKSLGGLDFTVKAVRK